MINEQTKKRVLVEQKQALELYVEAMLTEVSTPPETVVEVAEVPVSSDVLAPVVIPKARQISEGRPHWGEEEFQALLFKVGGLTLAVPLIELSGVEDIDFDKVVAMPGSVQWYLGLGDYRGSSVPIIDTAQLVLSEQLQERLGKDPKERIGQVVYIDDGRWGLGCDQVAQVLSLTPEQVSWRTTRTKRRWLAGTVLEQMCALIDPPAFAMMLENHMGNTPESGQE